MPGRRSGVYEHAELVLLWHLLGSRHGHRTIRLRRSVRDRCRVRLGMLRAGGEHRNAGVRASWLLRSHVRRTE